MSVEEVEHPDLKDTRVSPTELYYLKLHNHHLRSPALILFCDVYFRGLHLQLDEAMEIFKLAITLHPIAHSGFEIIKPVEEIKAEQSSARRVILPTREALDYDIVDRIGDDGECLEKTFRSFDLTKHGPVRFVFANKPFLAVRFVFHRVGFDHKAAEIFVSDVIRIMRKVNIIKEVSRFKCKHSRTTFQSLDRYLSSNFLPLRDIWIRKLTKRVQKSTFALKKPKNKLANQLYHVAYLSFSPFTSRKIFSTTLIQKVSLQSLIISLYQLFLSFIRPNKYVTVTTETDYRQVVPDAGEVVESLTNLIPIASMMPKKGFSLETFLLENDAVVADCLKQSAIPFIDLCLLADRSAAKYLNQHLVVNRLTEAKTEGLVQISPVKELGMQQETCLAYFYDEKRSILQIQLQASSDVYTLEETKNILKRFAKMLRITSRDTKLTINEMKGCIVNDRHFIDLKDSFQKIEGNNRGYPVVLALIEEDDQYGTSLMWTEGVRPVQRYLVFKSISNIHIINKDGGRALWVKTVGGEEHTFLFTRGDRVNTWVQRLEEIVNWGITHV